MKKALLFLAILLAFGCKKETTLETSDYFIFGTAYGFCAGSECVTLFKLEDQQLYADDNAGYTDLSASDQPFQTTSLPADKVALAEALQAQVPASLYEKPDGNVGCPDCRDQGLLFVKIKTGETVREWRIDPDEQQYAAFCDSIRATVQLLK
jgi:hypothetical protein